jgi:hypothetical protein
MNQAQRALVLMFSCLVAAALFFTTGPFSELHDNDGINTASALLGVPLPLVLIGVGLFVWLGGRKGGGRRTNQSQRTVVLVLCLVAVAIVLGSWPSSSSGWNPLAGAMEPSLWLTIVVPLVLVGLGFFLWFGGLKNAANRSIQRFVSPYLTHFVGHKFIDPDSPDYEESPKREEAQYAVLKAILTSRNLANRPNAPPGVLGYSVGMDTPLSTNEMVGVSVVCFCDIPLDDLGLHMGKYGEFGLCLRKQFLIERGVNPVLYVAEHAFVREVDAGGGAVHRQTRGEYFDEMGALYGGLHSFIWTRGTRPRDLEDPDLHEVFRDYPKLREHPAVERLYAKMDQLLRFFDAYLLGHVKCFNDKLPVDSADNFYMEREWRAVTRVDFALKDIAVVVVPRDYVGRLRADFPDVPRERIRPAEDCVATA